MKRETKKLSFLFFLFFIFSDNIKTMEKDCLSPIPYDDQKHIAEFLGSKELTTLSKVSKQWQYFALEEAETIVDKLKEATIVLNKMSQIKQNYAKNEDFKKDLVYIFCVKDLKFYMYDYVQSNLTKQTPSLDPISTWPLLHLLVSFGDSDLVECMINTIKNACSKKNLKKELKKHICYQDFNGKSPLHITAKLKENSAKTIKLLIENGANCNVKDEDGNTPLHLAAKEANFYAVKTLLSLGANYVELNLKQQTPEMYATENCIHCTKTYPNYCESHQKIVDLIWQSLYSKQVNNLNPKYTCTIF